MVEKRIHQVLTSLCIMLVIVALIVFFQDKTDKIALVSILVATVILGVMDEVEYGR